MALQQTETYFDSRPALARTVFLLAVACTIVYSAFWLYRYTSITTDENLYDDINGKVTVVAVTPGGASDRAGLLVGDTIIAINGQPVADKFEANDYLLISSGGSVLHYTIVRDGNTMELAVELAEFGLPLQYLAAVICALLLIALAMFVFTRRPSHRVARLFGWANLTFGFALLVHRGISVYHYPDALTAASIYLHPMLWPASVTLYMHLLLYFPAERYIRPLPPALLTLLYALPYTAFTTLLLLPGILGIRGLFAILPAFLALTASVFVVQHIIHRRMKNMENAEYPAQRRSVHIILLCTLLYIVTLLLLPLSSYWQVLYFPGILIPVALFVLIVRRRLFDLYIVVRRRSMYSVMNVALSTTVAALLLLAVIVLPKQGVDLPVLNITGGQVEILRLSSLAPERRQVFEKRLTFIAGILLVAALWWLYREGRRVLDARFYRGSLDYKRALTAFSKLSHSHSDPASLARAVVSDVVKLLHVRGALFALRDNGGFIPTAVHRLSLHGDDLVFDRADAESLQTALARASVQAVDNLALRERFASRGAEFIVGVPLEGRIEALLLLGEKESDTNYSREDVELLENLAINIADSLLTMRFYDGAREKERLRKELEIARQIQMQSLPAELPDFPGIAVAAESIPAYEVGGDFYDVLPRHDSATFLLGDVSGKGTSAALYLARLQGILKTIESFQPTLWELMVRLNTLIFDHLERRSFISIAALRVDFLSSNVHFIRAGHLPLLHYNALAREVHEYRPAGMAIGLDLHSFTGQLEEQTIFSRAGDVFVLVSDGVTEAADENGAHFGIDGVATCLAEHAAQSPREITASIIQAVRAHAVAEQDDDITILVLKCSISAGQ